MKEESSVFTIREATVGLFKDRGSRFIAHLYPIHSREDFDKRHAELKQLYHDARHICWAMRLGTDRRSSDDGEPSHSGGAPIMRQLLSHGIDYAALFVVRYFGGIKLGVPGLIHAYGTAAADAIAQAERIEWIEKVRFILIFSYHCTSTVEKQLKRTQARIIRSEYSEKCLIEVEIRRSQQLDFQHNLQECTESCTPSYGSS